MTTPSIDTPNQGKAQAILEQYDTESRFHKFIAGSPMAVIITVLASAISLFHLYTAYYGALPALLQRSVHLGGMLALAFLLYPAKKGGKLSALDVILALAGALTAGYILWDYHGVIQRIANESTLDLIVAGLAVVLVLEAGRRVVGKELSILALVFLIYAYFGPYMPGLLGHRGYDLQAILGFMYLTTEGLYGPAIGVSATFIILFIIFGAFLEKTGMGAFFNDLALGLAGASAGGPAKVAVVASGLLGSINGSAVANVVTTGAFTIPLMKRVGYPPEFAGAVEAAASVGGQILPPVMGAVAFIMAETLGKPYGEIAIAAAIPALLYFFSVGVMVHLRAKKRGLSGVPKEEIPNVRKVLLKGGHMLIPLLALIYMLMAGFTATRAAFLAIVLVVVASWVRKETRLTPKGFIDALESGARSALGVAIACGVVGLIVGVASQTGFAARLAGTIVVFAQGNMILTLVLTMIAALILGMGIPSIPCYIITVAVAAPALIELGVPVFSAHMFVFYFGMLANLTPPVALAAFAGAGLAGASPNKTGLAAMKLASAGFIVPFMFVYSPALLLQGTDIVAVVAAVITALIGVVGLGAAMEGWLFKEANLAQRLALLVGALLLIIPGGVTDVIGFVLLAAVGLWQKHTPRREHHSSTPRSRLQTPGS